MTILAERIRQRRKELGLSQNDLATAIKSNQGQISRYEQAMNDPSGEVLAALARTLNTSTDWLIGLDDNPERSLVIEGDLSQIERAVLLTLRRHPPRVQLTMLKLLRDFSSEMEALLASTKSQVRPVELKDYLANSDLPDDHDLLDLESDSTES